MGTVYSAYIKAPDVAPNWREPPIHDSLYGFSEGRKERVMTATEEELRAAGVKQEHRDYCGHHLIDFYKCRHKNFPWVAACSHIKHEWDSCEFDDYVLRMKEYERERRLLERAKRKGIKENNEELGD